MLRRRGPILKKKLCLPRGPKFGKTALAWWATSRMDHENDLIRVIEKLHCNSRKATHDRVLSTTQFNGCLAASMVNLRLLSKLSAFGKTALAISCKASKATFDAKMTNFGPQWKFGKYTINRNGWKLVPISPCYWAVHKLWPARSVTMRWNTLIICTILIQLITTQY